MVGGNDGLNMVIPIEDYGNYLNARKNIAIAQKQGASFKRDRKNRFASWYDGYADPV